MEIRTFKKIINDLLISEGLSKKGSYYYSCLKDLIIVLGMQKSNYAKGYYINIGYIIIEINPLLEIPRDTDGDIRARFSFKKDGKSLDYFDLETLSESDYDEVKRQIEENIKHYIASVISLDALKNLLNKKPVMLYQTTLSAKKFLGYEV